MEHTDAGVHTVLADVERPAEHHTGPAGEVGHTGVSLPVPASSGVVAGAHPRPAVPTAAAVAPPVMPGRGRPELIEPGYDTAVDDLDDEDVDTDDEDDENDEDGALARPGDVRMTRPDGSLADSLAQVIDIGLGDLLGEAMEWQERALCAQTDPEAFFPEKGGSTREAKRICSGCEVRVECLEYALENDERFGIWGGMSERERRKQRRRAV
ncbi:WhiB family transcriptional regulator, redox-sensing transcriptional regulator [Frankia sp. EI5c]|nr:WhiB family transcriptional regulator, redox-sensing transcriptional regulator [Frankia sp. EI5c]